MQANIAQFSTIQFYNPINVKDEVTEQNIHPVKAIEMFYYKNTRTVLITLKKKKEL